jgi:glutamate-1-semialdehyde aminotransferase
MRDAGVLLPFSPLAACHVCIGTSTDDVDEMITAPARAFGQLTSQTHTRSA